MRLKTFGKVLLGGTLMASLFSCSIFSNKPETADYSGSKQFADGKFQNQKDFAMNDSVVESHIA